MSAHQQLLDADALLSRIAQRVPTNLRENVVIIGSIACAWSFRDIFGNAAVATKDIDLLLRPAVDAISSAEALGQQLLDQGWRPHYPNGQEPGGIDTPEEALPALRLSPPEEDAGWFVELLGSPEPGQEKRRVWRRFETDMGHFALPCFRFMPVATCGAELSDYGFRIASPSSMALAHLLEHSEPDKTPISGLHGNPPRYVKDVGRAVALWWLALEQSSAADEEWLAQWQRTLHSVFPGNLEQMKAAAEKGLAVLESFLGDAHVIAVTGVLAAHSTTLPSFKRAFGDLSELIAEL